jgi:hypothetical protein
MSHDRVNFLLILVAGAVGLAGLIVSILALRAAKRSALAAESAATASDRSAVAAEDSATSARRSADAAELGAAETGRQARVAEETLEHLRESQEAAERAAAQAAAVRRAETVIEQLAALELEAENAGPSRPGHANRTRERGRNLLAVEWTQAIDSPLLTDAERTRLRHLSFARAPTIFGR